MPFDFDDLDNNKNPDSGGHSHGLFGHGGFFEPNHFERPEFFTTPSKSGKNDKGLYKFLYYLISIGAVVLIGLITIFILFS